MGYLPNAGIAAFIGGITHGAPFNIEEFMTFFGLDHPPFGGENLPRGLDIQQSQLCEQYLTAVWRISDPQERSKFITSDKSEGKAVFQKWYSHQWQKGRCSVKFDNLMHREGVDGAQLISVVGVGNYKIQHAVNAFLPIAEELFGRTVIIPTGESSTREFLHTEWKTVMNTLVYASYDRANKIVRRVLNTLDTKLEQLEDELKDLLDGTVKITTRRFDLVTRKLVEAKSAAIAGNQHEKQVLIEEMEMGIDRLLQKMKAGGGKRKKADQAESRLSKFTVGQLQVLATDAEIDGMWAMYEERFDFENDPEIGAQLEARILELTNPNAASRGAITSADIGTNLGVDMESKFSDEELRNGFGVGSQWFGFNEFLHLDEFNPTEHKEMFHSKHRSRFTKLTLRWHQQVGVAALVRCLFSKEYAPRNYDREKGYALLADEVGVGKTFQVLGLLTLLAHLRKLNKESKPFPPLLKNCASLGDINNGFPEAPTLIIASGTLVAQWRSEAFKVLLPGSFDIFVYPGQKLQRDEFWSDDGPWRSSKQPMSRRIILASSSAIMNEGSGYLNGSEKKDRYSEAPRISRRIADDDDKHLFALNYGLLIIDEAHMYRNRTGGYQALLALRDRACAVIACTATPLHTSPKDLASLGRIIGHHEFMTTACDDMERAQIREVNRAKRQIRTEETRELIIERQRGLMRGETLDGEDPTIPVRETHLKHCREWNALFGDYLIRRDADSPMFNGKPCVDIPPMKLYSINVKLTSKESEKIAAAASRGNTDMEGHIIRASDCDSSRFYLDYRMGLFHPDAISPSKLPRMTTKEDYQLGQSTKINTVIKLIRHHLSGSTESPVFDVDGDHQWPPSATTTLPSSSIRPRPKIVVYQSFTSLSGFLQKCFTVNDIRSILVNGGMSFEQRSAAIEKFRTDPDINVLILSAVGSVGLNLAFASAIAFMDQVWSGQDRHQIIGRCKRTGQKNTVVVWDILAIGTTDVVMSEMASAKEKMLSAFLASDVGATFVNAMIGDHAIDSISAEAESEDEPKPKPKVSRSKKNEPEEKKQPKKRKAKRQQDVDEEVDEVREPPQKQRREKKARPAKKSELEPEPEQVQVVKPNLKKTKRKQDMDEEVEEVQEPSQKQRREKTRPARISESEPEEVQVVKPNLKKTKRKQDMDEEVEEVQEPSQKQRREKKTRPARISESEPEEVQAVKPKKTKRKQDANEEVEPPKEQRREKKKTHSARDSDLEPEQAQVVKLKKTKRKQDVDEEVEHPVRTTVKASASRGTAVAQSKTTKGKARLESLGMPSSSMQQKIFRSALHAPVAPETQLPPPKTNSNPSNLREKRKELPSESEDSDEVQDVTMQYSSVPQHSPMDDGVFEDVEETGSNRRSSSSDSESSQTEGETIKLRKSAVKISSTDSLDSGSYPPTYGSVRKEPKASASQHEMDVDVTSARYQGSPKRPLKRPNSARSPQKERSDEYSSTEEESEDSDGVFPRTHRGQVGSSHTSRNLPSNFASLHLENKSQPPRAGTSAVTPRITSTKKQKLR